MNRWYLFRFQLLSFLIILTIGCAETGSGPAAGEPNLKPTASLQVSPDEGIDSVAARIQSDGVDPDGTVEQYLVDLGKGDGFQLFDHPVDTTITYHRTTDIQARVVDDDEAESDEEGVQVTVTPTYAVALSLRDLLKDGEPVITAGTTTYTIGDSTWTATGDTSITVPEGIHQVNATHEGGGIADKWTFIYLRGQDILEEALEQRDPRDRDSPLEITGDLSLEIYKIDTTDVTAIENQNGPEETGRNFYNMEDVATVLDSRKEPGTDRYAGITESNPLVIWVNTTESIIAPVSEIEVMINEWWSTRSGASASAFTHGYLGPHNMTLKEGGTEPDENYIEIIYNNTLQAAGTHLEIFDDENNPNRVTRSIVGINPDKADRGVTATLLTQSIGARSSVGTRLEDELSGRTPDEYFDEYRSFGEILGKLLYTTKEGTRFRKEGTD